MQFTDDEIETIKSIINEYGSDCPYTDYDKVKELKYKLGLSKRPTPEEIAEKERKQKEFNESPQGKLIAEMVARQNDLITAQLLSPNIFIDQHLWDNENFKIGSTLRIKLPKDYQIKDANLLHINKLTFVQKLYNVFRRK